jgi:hypothetical protein
MDKFRKELKWGLSRLVLGACVGVLLGAGLSSYSEPAMNIPIAIPSANASVNACLIETEVASSPPYVPRGVMFEQASASLTKAAMLLQPLPPRDVSPDYYDVFDGEPAQKGKPKSKRGIVVTYEPSREFKFTIDKKCR